MSEAVKEYLDDKVVYAFIRQDIEVKHQIVQFGHAVRQATIEYVKLVYGLDNGSIAHPSILQGISFLTTVGMPDAKSLDRVIAKLKANSIGHTPFHDTDYQFGVISVVTEPLPLSVREKPDGLMCNYRLWNPANNKAEPVIGEVSEDATWAFGEAHELDLTQKYEHAGVQMRLDELLGLFGNWLRYRAGGQS